MSPCGQSHAEVEISNNSWVMSGQHEDPEFLQGHEMIEVLKWTSGLKIKKKRPR